MSCQPEPLGVLIRRLRLAAGLSQRDLARRAQVSQAMVSLLESGQRGRRLTLAVAVRLSGAIGVRPETLAAIA